MSCDEIGEHVCPGCRASFVGLDDYVSHRLRCSDVMKSEIFADFNTKQVVPEIPESENFFSSLELQSKFSYVPETRPQEAFQQTEENRYDFIDLKSVNYDEDLSVPPVTHTGGKWKPGTRPLLSSNCRVKETIDYPTRRSCRAVWKGLPEGCGKRKRVECKDLSCDRNEMSESVENSTECQSDSALHPNNKINGDVNAKGAEEAILDVTSICDVDEQTTTKPAEFDCSGRKSCKFEPRNSLRYTKMFKKVKICANCNQAVILKNKSEIQRHYRRHHKDMLYACSVCNFGCVFKYQLLRHLKNKDHHGNDFRCSVCDFNTSERISFLLHVIIHQSPVKVDSTNGTIDKYKCPICDKLLCATSLRQHIYKHTGDRHYTCNVCNRQFIQRGSLWAHTLTHSESNLKKCDRCDFTTYNRNVLNRHTMIHTDRKRKYQCEICGSKHYDKMSLNKHKLTHLESEKRPFKCTEDDCDKRFYSKSDLVYHVRIHRNECPYKCDICDYKGKTAHQLTKHKRSHTGEKPFSCPYCSYSSAYSTHLTRHLLIHSGDKPYSCPYCTFKCNLVENVRKHILTTKKHKGKKVYPCKYCSNGYNDRLEFKSHLLADHREHFPDGNIDIVSVISGLFEKVNVRKEEIVDPILYTPKSERKVKQKSKAKSRIKNGKNCDKEKRNEKDSQDVVSNRLASEISVVECDGKLTDFNSVTGFPDISFRQFQDVDPSGSSQQVNGSNSMISVSSVDIRQPENNAMNYVIESMNYDENEQVELTHLVTLNLPIVDSDENPENRDVFIYV